ncbi:hypothetical protein Leryth_024977 [Lithospermum erythrorhizon]|nr:hypothetical protein Leryth_024977 [Lithospermum erythrorhizon]
MYETNTYLINGYPFVSPLAKNESIYGLTTIASRIGMTATQRVFNYANDSWIFKFSLADKGKGQCIAEIQLKSW